MSSELHWNTAPTGVTLWGVYGPECFPTVFACQLRDYFWHERAIWGFSNYEGEPGFRTLGVNKAWADQHELRLFATREAAFAHISSLFPAQQAEASPQPTGDCTGGRTGGPVGPGTNINPPPNLEGK